MIRDLSDQELAMVNGGNTVIGPVNVTVNMATTVQNNYNIVYAPISIYDSNISSSTVASNNTYKQNIAPV